jgi:hypothetical protein
MSQTVRAAVRKRHDLDQSCRSTAHARLRKVRPDVGAALAAGGADEAGSMSDSRKVQLGGPRGDLWKTQPQPA